jgi:hypothetical protein
MLVMATGLKVLAGAEQAKDQQLRVRDAPAFMVTGPAIMQYPACRDSCSVRLLCAVHARNLQVEARTLRMHTNAAAQGAKGRTSFQNA